MRPHDVHRLLKRFERRSVHSLLFEHSAAPVVCLLRHIGRNARRSKHARDMIQRPVVATKGRFNIGNRQACFPTAGITLIASQRLERPGVVLQRLFVRKHGARRMTGFQQIVDRLVAPVAEAVVMRQQTVVVIQIVGVALFQILADPTVQFAPPGVQHALVCHFLQQRMTEHMHPFRLKPFEHGDFLLVQVGQLAQQRNAVDALDRLQDAKRNTLPDDRRHAQYIARVFVKAINARQKQTVQAIGQVIDSMEKRLVRLSQNSPQQFRQEQRVARRSRCDLTAQCLRQLHISCQNRHQPVAVIRWKFSHFEHRRLIIVQQRSRWTVRSKQQDRMVAYRLHDTSPEFK